MKVSNMMRIGLLLKHIYISSYLKGNVACNRGMGNSCCKELDRAYHHRTDQVAASRVLFAYMIDSVD